MVKGNTKEDTTPCVRYRVTSKTKIIWKLICAWAKLQSSRRLSIVFICEVMRKSFGDGDLIASAVATNNEKVLAIMREFTSDICAVEFNSKADNIPKQIDLTFYKDSDTLYEWLNKQTSIVNSLSFAIYSFIRVYGMRDVVSVIADAMLKDKNFFDVFDLLSTSSTDNNAGSTGTDTNGKLDIDAVL
jgi:hypothetical protein